MKWALAICLAFGWGTVSALTITHVAHEAEVIRPDRGEVVAVRFRLSEPALAVMSVYDGNDVLRRKIYSAGVLEAGDHKLRWDGRDADGRVVAPGAYHYTLTAYSPSGASVEYDVTDLTGGKAVWINNVVWEPDNRRIRYVLPGPARVNIRVGLARNRVLMKTVLNWAVRPSGRHSEEWDGRDASGTLDIGSHPDRFIAVRALLLSRNTVIVDRPEVDARPAMVRSQGGERRLRKKARRKRMYDPAQIPPEKLGDFVAKVVLRLGRGTVDGAVAAGRGPLSLTIDVPPDVRARIADERFELVIFVDGMFADELEAGMLPLTWVWDASAVAPGRHFVTVNIRGYEGNFGTGTLPIELR